MLKLLRRLLTALLLLLADGLAWLWLAPPELIRVGAGYSAKIVCSNVFLAGRDPEEVMRVDVQSPGHPLLRLMRVSVDREARTVRAGLFGFAGGGLAVAREGTGCASVPDGDLAAARRHAAPAAPAPEQGFRCDGRTRCRQMRSCAEAMYFLKHCPGVHLDGDGNGVPCEQQWCGRP